MSKINWKSLLLITGVAGIGAGLFVFGVLWTVRLPIFGWSGLMAFAALLVLTLVSSRFTVPVTNVDRTSQTHKSVADAFIFLAVMMYALAPANSVGPPIVLAALVGFVSSLYFADRWSSLFAVGTSIISTFAASMVYRLMVLALAGGTLDANERGLVLDVLLFPLCVFGIVQYALSTFGTVAFNSFCLGKAHVTVSQESLIWTLI